MDVEKADLEIPGRATRVKWKIPGKEKAMGGRKFKNDRWATPAANDTHHYGEGGNSRQPDG
jgi:hypothetical protein